MDNLAAVTGITSLNDVLALGELFRGDQFAVDLNHARLVEKEAVVAVAWLLPRSASTLTKLDLRSSVRNAKART